jgi:hypothetical protein
VYAFTLRLRGLLASTKVHNACVAPAGDFRQKEAWVGSNSGPTDPV